MTKAAELKKTRKYAGRSLRKEYGESFAKGHRKDMMLKTLLKETGSTSLHEYLRQHHR